VSAEAKRSNMMVKMSSFTGYCRGASREDLDRVKYRGLGERRGGFVDCLTTYGDCLGDA